LNGQASLFAAFATPAISALQQMSALNLQTAKRFTSDNTEGIRAVLMQNDYAKLAEVVQHYALGSGLMSDYKAAHSRIIGEAQRQFANVTITRSEVVAQAVQSAAVYDVDESEGEAEAQAHAEPDARSLEGRADIDRIQPQESA
jgi:hypothetical protein